MKVYCKDCKHFHYVNEFHWSCYCDAPELGEVVDYIHGNYKRTISEHEENYPNNRETNGCTFYKPSLFKRIKDYFKRGKE